MVKAPRKKLVIVVLVFVAAVTVVFAVQPVRDAICFVVLSSAEKKVVGEWLTNSIGGAVVTTIHADHSWTSTGGCLEPPPTIRGTWRIDGSDVVFYFDSGQFGHYGTPDPRRRAIQELIDTDREVRSWASRAPDK